MSRSRGFFLGLFFALVVVSTATASAAEPPAQPTEPFFPRSGNSGYDVKHYDVSLGYQPRSGSAERARRGRSAGDEWAEAVLARPRRAEGDLGRRRRGTGRLQSRQGKVKIVPATPIAKGEAFTVKLRYQGLPRKVTDPDGSIEGWYRTKDGAVAVGEPIGTAAWLACNNTPRDKASFQIQITVPAGLMAVSNGRSYRATGSTGAHGSLVGTDADGQLPGAGRHR